MVEQILGDKTQCIAKDVLSHVTKYEYHPLSVQDLKEAVQPLKHAKKSWKQSRIGDFEFELPIPELPPEGQRSNSWRVMIYFMYHPTKNIFKVEMYKHAMSVYEKYPTYNSSRQVYKFSRKGTTKEDLDTDTFLYYLRDMMGIYFTKLKHTQVCGRLVDNYSKTYKLLCGYNVKTKGAMCQECRNKHLKRKFNDI
jgi:hypothetical protein